VEVVSTRVSYSVLCLLVVVGFVDDEIAAVTQLHHLGAVYLYYYSEAKCQHQSFECIAKWRDELEGP
jgi:hypothetical protein